MVYILDAVRTARGKAKDTGALHGVKPADLLAELLKGFPDRTGLDLSHVDDLVIGCVTQTGEQGSNIARTGALLTEQMERVGGITINRYCTSGLDAALLAASKIQAGVDGIAIAGGVECMSRVPVFADKGAFFFDPGIAARARAVPIGISADLIATMDGITRSEADSYACLSQSRAASAQENGYFRSIVPILNRETGQMVDMDECIRKDITIETLAELAPSFAKAGAAGIDDRLVSMYQGLDHIDHIHHVGNAPAMCDGASAVVLAGQEGLDIGGLEPRAKILAVANACVEPVVGLTGGYKAAMKALCSAGMAVSDVDLVEFNEAYAAVAIKFLNDSGFSDGIVNVNGGAIALGHAMGSTGTALIGTVLDELERRDLRTGLIAVSGGAGVGTAMIIERV